MAVTSFISLTARYAALLMILESGLQPVFAAQQQEGKEPIILNTANLPPHHYTRDDRLLGTIPPVIECALNTMHQPYRIQVLPWKRAQKEVEEGIAQGFFAGRGNPQRDRYATASDPVNYKVWNWYVHKDIALKPNDSEFKKNVLVGTLAGTDDEAELKRDGYRTVPLKNPEQIAQMLNAKRIGATKLVDESMEDGLKKANGSLNDFNTYLYGAYPNVCYFGNDFLKENPDFIYQFNDALGHCFNPRRK